MQANLNSITQHSTSGSTQSLWPLKAHRAVGVLINTLESELQLMTLPYIHLLRYQIAARCFGINLSSSYWAKADPCSSKPLFYISLCKAVFLQLYSKSNRTWAPAFTLSAKPAQMAAHTNALPPPEAGVTDFFARCIYMSTSITVAFDKIPVIAMITALIGLLFGEPARDRPDKCK